VAFSGRSEEYALATAFFDALLRITGVPKERLFVIPGNHDVDRSVISTAAAGLPGILTSRDAANQLLNDADDRSLAFRKLRGYQTWIKDYFQELLPYDNDRYFYVRHFEAAKKKVAVLGLNSAWLCAGDTDRNRLLIGERQVRAALDKAGEADLKIAMVHHPFDWLQDFDREDVSALLSDACDFIVHGHMHQIGLLHAQTPDSRTMFVAAGALYDHRQYPNSYNLVQLDLATGQGTVYLRMYSDRNGGFWAWDTLNYRNIAHGQLDFPLPESLWAATNPTMRTKPVAEPRELPPSPTAPAPAQPVLAGAPPEKLADSGSGQDRSSGVQHGERPIAGHEAGKAPTSGEIRRLLESALAHNDFENLLQDHFPSVYRNAGGMSRAHKTRALLDYLLTRPAEIDLLLREVQSVNGDGFTRWKNRSH
jgi:predicted phosphodiesterase